MYDSLPSFVTVGFDREIFSGNPSLKDLEKYTVKLSAEEKGNRDTAISYANSWALRSLDFYSTNPGEECDRALRYLSDH